MKFHFGQEVVWHPGDSRPIKGEITDGPYYVPQTARGTLRPSWVVLLEEDGCSPLTSKARLINEAYLKPAEEWREVEGHFRYNPRRCTWERKVAP